MVTRFSDLKTALFKGMGNTYIMFIFILDRARTSFTVKFKCAFLREAKSWKLAPVYLTLFVNSEWRWMPWTRISDSPWLLLPSESASFCPSAILGRDATIQLVVALVFSPLDYSIGPNAMLAGLPVITLAPLQRALHAAKRSVNDLRPAHDHVTQALNSKNFISCHCSNVTWELSSSGLPKMFNS